ncbi:hypothetical protein [Tessaracoccus coleopterorum]|uniref:hypothetical protein n=1 Tax=Tessaracoccus coleopterorum TaxID=2714950 RepID=UPI001E4EC090|nr:hypothetical protein [Tessaracoccus coleopterorum]
MKFTDGYWAIRPEYTALYAVEIDDVRADPARGTLTVYAATAVIRSRGDILNRPMLTITYSSPAPGVITTEIVHHAGRPTPGPEFALNRAEGSHPRSR